MRWQRIIPILFIPFFLIFSFPIYTYAASLLTIDSVSAAPDPFSPDGDGLEDETTIFALISAVDFISNSRLTVSCALNIVNPQGQLVKTLKSSSLIENTIPSTVSFIWDGKDKQRKVVENGTYTYEVNAAIKKIQALPKVGEVTVYIEPRLSVAVTLNYWNIGETDPEAIVTMTRNEKISVLNDGNLATTYSLGLLNPSGWQASQAQVGRDRYILNAAFASSSKKIQWDETVHALSTSPVVCTETKFAGDQTGVNVVTDDARTLWLQFKAPTQTTIETQQSIEVIINAEQP